jgi:large subunit ribosomal protein L46
VKLVLTERQAAKRVLDQTCGVNMNTWFVGRHPVGHFVADTVLNDTPVNGKANEKKEDQVQPVHDTAEAAGEKTFFMKARIFAGQADVKEANGNYEDFKWLAKEEIQKKVHPKYWSRIKNMLVEQ